MIKKASLKKRSAGIEKILVLGIGNTIRGDDAAGILAVRALGKHLSCSLRKRVDIKELEDSGINLLEILSGYKKAILVDSVSTKNAKPGTIHRLDKSSFLGKNSGYSTHQFGIPTIMEMAADLRLDFPGKLKLYAVEIEPEDDFSTKVNPVIKQAVKCLVQILEKDIIALTRRR